MLRTSLWVSLPLTIAACTGAPNTIEVSLAPSLISSLDGRTTVTALVADDTTPLPNTSVQVAIDYTDRTGRPHVIDSIDGTTDESGVFSTTVAGLAWDGTGTITVTTGGESGQAVFAVLDRTPPKVTILPPTTNLRVGPGLPLDVQIRVTDEIGVGQVILDATGGFGGDGRSTTLVSGTQDGTATFRIDVPGGAQPGPTLVLYALATDLSGNSAVAMPITLIVDPTITIATPPGLAGALLTDGNVTLLNDPRSIAASPRDGKLYVADVAGAACQGGCIWQVDPMTGMVNPTPIFVGQGEVEGVAFDVNGDNLYFTDRQDRTGRLTWNGTGYATPVTCNNVGAQRPQDPYHLVFDPTLGLLAADGNRQELVRIATCSLATTGVDFTAHNFDQLRGIALGPTGQIYVSDEAADEIVRVDRTTGATSVFETRIQSPYGVEWLETGTTAYASSLMVASGDRVIESTKGSGALAAAYLRNTPIDLAFIAGTMFVLTSPSQNDRGRIYRVSGF